MTQQFKFGDRVRHKEHGESVVVWTTDDTADQWVEVAYQNGKVDAYPNTDLKLIPHPDTVRLDWLAKNDCSLTERLCDEDKDLLEKPFAVIQIQENHFEVLAAASNIRQAIDNALKEEQEK